MKPFRTSLTFLTLPLRRPMCGCPRTFFKGWWGELHSSLKTNSWHHESRFERSSGRVPELVGT